MATNENVPEMRLQQQQQQREEEEGYDDFEEAALPPVLPLPALTPSQERLKQEMLGMLANPHQATIRVEAWPGSGSRTIMQHVVNEVQELLLFDIAMLICVRGYWVEEVQEKIAKGLSLNVEAQEGVDSLAAKIGSCLDGKKYMFCLYSVIEPTMIKYFSHDVVEIMKGAGIPQPDQQNGCKFVFLIYNFVSNADLRIRDTLSEEEALELFREKAGEVVDSPNIQPLARQFTESRFNLIQVAGAIMKDVKDESLWEELRRDNRPFRFWYERIASDEEKMCSSYCCLFEAEYEMDINELIGYWIMDGIFDGFEEEGGMMKYRKGLGILKRLLHSSILQRVTHHSVRMHFLTWYYLRHMNPRFKVAAVSHEINWESEEKLSLMDIKGFQDIHPNCPTLSTLLLWRRSKSAQISDEFFERMPKLQILHLNYVSASLPSSISKLDDLRALVLRECKILRMELDLQSLKKLEMLDVSGTLIESLPESVSTLYNLRKLLAKNCRLLNRIPDLTKLDKLEVLEVSGTLIESLPDSVSTLYNLKKLLAMNCRLLKRVPDFAKLDKLEVLEVPVMEIDKCPDWIFKLTRLRQLNWYHCGLDSLNGPFPNKLAATIHVSDANFFRTFSKYAQSLPQCFQRFHFCVSPHLDREEYGIIYFKSKQFVYNHIHPKAKYFSTYASRDRCFEINGSTSSWGSIGGSLNHADLLSLIDNNSLLSLSELDFKHMKELRECWIERCHKIAMIVNGDEVKGDKILEKLENLFLSNLSNLMSICSGLFLPEGSFACLKHVYLDCCPKLRIVFSSALVVVEKLETLEIKYCDKLEMIFREEVEGLECVFPSLISLVLWELPELESICRWDFSAPRLERIKVKECPKLKNIPHIAPSERTEEHPPVVERRRWHQIFAQHLRSVFNNLKKGIFSSNTSATSKNSSGDA